MSDELPEETGTATSSEVLVSRSPRYGRFMLAGVLVFAVVALILTFSFPQGQGYDAGQVFGFLLLFGSVAGIALGSIAAIVVDRVTTHRARTVMADRIDVRTTTDEPDAGGPQDRSGETSESR
jgi:hypothetical protein